MSRYRHRPYARTKQARPVQLDPVDAVGWFSTQILDFARRLDIGGRDLDVVEEAAERYVNEHDAVRVDQFHWESNKRAHYQGTGREIWEQSPRLQRIREIRRSNLQDCSTCSKLPYCGRCHAQALVEDGDILGPSSAACAYAAALEDAAQRGA